MKSVVSSAMACMYLRSGDPTASRRRWPYALGTLRAACPSSRSEAQTALILASLDEEASILGQEERWTRAETLVQAGQIITIADTSYPGRWRSSLMMGAPPALWVTGALRGGPFVAIVGSREPDPGMAEAVDACVADIGAMGYGVVSGGARGIDRLAAKAALRYGLPIIEILPTISHEAGYPTASLSINPAGMGVSTSSFMERNVLIYALAEFAVVFGPRFKAGGTWHGAIEASRRHLTRLLVYENPDSPGTRALIALGASHYSPQRGVAASLARENHQIGLPLVEPW